MNSWNRAREKRRFWYESIAYCSVVARANGTASTAAVRAESQSPPEPVVGDGWLWKTLESRARRRYESASVSVDDSRVCPLK